MSEKERKIREAQFHDNLYGVPKERIPFTFYRDDFVEALRRHAIDFLGDMNGKRLLFCGCGLQWSLVKKFYQQGAEVVIIDISSAAIEYQKKKIALLEDKGNRIKPLVMDCEALEFDDGNFDIAFDNAIIHHLYIPKVAKEIYRVMKAGGRASFIEPLGMNPFINLYRRFTPHQRTSDEHPLTYDDFAVFDRIFPYFRHEEFTLSTLVPVVWNAIAMKWGALTLSPVEGFMKMDDFLLRRFPFLRRFCWNTEIYLRK